MSKKDFTLTTKILLLCIAAADVATSLSYTALLQKSRYGKKASLNQSLYRLYKKGWLRSFDKQGQKFLKLTKDGQIEALLAKARIPVTGDWDGKWRIIFYDIPEGARSRRDLLRRLLKNNNYVRLQNSVYASPRPFNPEAVRYLKETKLIGYIKLVEVEHIDDDRKLKKRFHLK